MEPTILGAIIGAVATITAAYIAIRGKEKKNYTSMLLPSEYGIRIDKPDDGESVDRSFPVKGTYKKLPEDHHIWVSTFSIIIDRKGYKTKHYWPQEKATTEDGHWYSRVNNIGGNPDETKEFLVIVAGKEGQALIKHFSDAGNETKTWVPIKKLTSDIIECAVGRVRLK